MKKTNAMRELDKDKIPYKAIEYQVDENDVSAIAVATETGEDITRIFKTLVLLNEKNDMVVACIPGADSIDLKKLAKVAGCKRVEMIHVKDLLSMTGYIRGGCSPVGIKKKHVTFIHKNAPNKEKILISGGMRGIQIEIDPKVLIKYLDMKVEDIII